MLHSAMVSSTFTNSFGAGNEGAPAKFGNADIGSFANNILIANCNSLLAFDPNKPPDFNQYLSMPCRAGDALPIGTRMWSQYTVSNNTWESTFSTFVDDACDDGAGCTALPSISRFNFQNNIFLGFLDSNTPSYSGSLPAIYCGGSCNGTNNTNANWQWLNNMGFNIRNSPTGTGNQWSTDPLVVTKIPDIASFAAEVNALTFDMHLTSSSPAIGAGVQNAYVPTTDFAGNTRPNPPSIGAYEFEGATVPIKVVSGISVFSGSVQF
jgi:hypothetical protein